MSAEAGQIYFMEVSTRDILINIDIEHSSMVTSEDPGTTEGREVIQEEEQRLDATYFLKQLALEPNVPIETLATDIDPPYPVKTAQKIVEDCAKLLVGTIREADYPERIRAYYNKGAESEDQLTQQDMMTLLDVITNKYHSKLMTKKHADQLGAKMKKMGLPTTREPSAEAMAEIPANSGIIPPAPVQTIQTPTYTATNSPSQNVVWTAADSRAQLPPPAPTSQTASSQQAQSIYENEDSLMKFLLEINHGINPQQLSKIPYFMMMFRTTKFQWIKNPSKLLMLLKSTFGLIHGETVFVQFMDMKSQVSSDPQNLYRLTGASEYTPVNPVENLMPSMGGQANPIMQGWNAINESGGEDQYENARERRMDRLLERMMKAKYISIMENMGTPQGNGNSHNEQFFNPYEYDVFEDYDKDGRVIAKRYVRKNPMGMGMNGGGDKNAELMLNFFKMMHDESTGTNRILLEKVLNGGNNNSMNEIINTVLKQAMGSINEQRDPVAQFNRTLDLGERIAQIRSQNSTPKSIEEKKLELDFLLAKEELEGRKAEKTHEWTRQQIEAENSNKNIESVIGGLTGAVKEVAAPIVNTVLATYGRGLAGGMPGGQDPRMQQQQRPPQQVIIQQPPQQERQPTIAEVMASEEAEAEKMRRIREAEAARYQNQTYQDGQQQQVDNRPIEEQLKDYDDEQLEEMAYRGQLALTEHERVWAKVMKERARRKGQGVNIPRQHVSPIVEQIAAHEEAQQSAQYVEQNQPVEQKYDVFNEADASANVDEPKPFALDTSIPANEQVAMSPEEEDELIQTGTIAGRQESSMGIPSTTNIAPEPSEEEALQPVQQQTPAKVVEEDEEPIEGDEVYEGEE